MEELITKWKVKAQSRHNEAAELEHKAASLRYEGHVFNECADSLMDAIKKDKSKQ